MRRTYYKFAVRDGDRIVSYFDRKTEWRRGVWNEAPYTDEMCHMLNCSPTILEARSYVKGDVLLLVQTGGRGIRRHADKVEAPRMRAIAAYDASDYDAATKPAWNAYKAATKSAQDAYEPATKPAWDAYKVATKPARKAYEAAEKSARKAYEAATKPAQDAYEAAEKSAWDAYKAAEKPARDAYEAAEKPARDAYNAATKSARDAYEAAVLQTLTTDERRIW